MKSTTDTPRSAYPKVSSTNASSSSSTKGKGLATKKTTPFKATTHSALDKHLLANPSLILRESNADATQLSNRVTRQALSCLKQVNTALCAPRQEYMLSLAHKMVKTCGICTQKIAGNVAYHENCRMDFHPDCLDAYIRDGLEKRAVKKCPGHSCQKDLTWSERSFYTLYLMPEWKSEPIKIDHQNALDRQDFMSNLRQLPSDTRAGIIQGDPSLKELFHNDLTRSGLLTARPDEGDGYEETVEEVIEGANETAEDD